MNREDIIRMAQQVGYPIHHYEWEKATEEFAALVANHVQGVMLKVMASAVAAEREACASIDFRHIVGLSSDQDFLVSQAIRARGQA